MVQPRGNTASSRIVRLMISNWAFGWAVGFAGAGAVLISNVGGIRELTLRSDMMLQALVLLFGGFGLFFGGVVCATAVMLLPTKEENESRGGGGKAAPVLLPAYALARIRGPRR
ncbi:hypothetical protein [uncultured Rhodoblastus sp.]|uniref:hypothetical protein n=1 Tax=uncultured Rhodoblastus sp. TaxID=543037 RepID=UPI0025FEDD39|nr:hypothetical protein [uncultured Rhodoblastus sp.]